MKTVVKENANGGKGQVVVKYILDDNELNAKCKMFAEVTIAPGCSLGYHEHHGETETYHIIAGEGVYGDNGAERAIYAETGSLTDRKKPAKSYDFADFLVRPTGFEPAAFRVGVIRLSSRKPLWHNGLVGVAQICGIL